MIRLLLMMFLLGCSPESPDDTASPEPDCWAGFCCETNAECRDEYGGERDYCVYRPGYTWGVCGECDAAIACIDDAGNRGECVGVSDGPNYCKWGGV